MHKGLDQSENSSLFQLWQNFLPCLVVIRLGGRLLLSLLPQVLMSGGSCCLLVCALDAQHCQMFLEKQELQSFPYHSWSRLLSLLFLPGPGFPFLG